MGGEKIKTLVIAALLLLNIFFLAFIVLDRAEEGKTDRQTALNTCAALAEGGITLLSDDIGQGGALGTMRWSRDLEVEALIVAALLGRAEMTEQGVMYLYESEVSGTASFRGSGEFSVNINPGAVPAASGTMKTVRKLLRNMKLETSEFYLSGSLGSETITAVCAYKKASIFNCTIKFVFEDGNLVYVTGRYVTGIEPVPDGAALTSSGTALLGFLAAVKRGEFDCARIDSVAAGYQLRETSPFGDGVLAPAWLISADSGRYIIDTGTGEIRALPPVYE